MKLWAYADERYPEYGLLEKPMYGERPVELTDEEYADWKRVSHEWLEWQCKIQSLPKLEPV